MLKTYDEMYKNLIMSKERALWEIARELSRKNDLLEVEMLCKTGDALRSAAKSSGGEFHYLGYGLAKKLAIAANERITKICGLPEDLDIDEGEDDDETSRD